MPEGVEAEALRRGWGAAERALEKWLAYALLPGGPWHPGAQVPVLAADKEVAELALWQVVVGAAGHYGRRFSAVLDAHHRVWVYARNVGEKRYRAAGVAGDTAVHGVLPRTADHVRGVSPARRVGIFSGGDRADRAAYGTPRDWRLSQSPELQSDPVQIDVELDEDEGSPPPPAGRPAGGNSPPRAPLVLRDVRGLRAGQPDVEMAETEDEGGSLHSFTPSPTTPTDRDRSRSNGAARADTADGAEGRQEGLVQQADQAEPAAEPVPPQVAAVAALGQAAQRWQRGVEAAVRAMGPEVAAQAMLEGPPARTPPVFGGGQVLRTVLAIQGGLQGLPGAPSGTPDLIQIDVDLEAEADYEVVQPMGE